METQSLTSYYKMIRKLGEGGMGSVYLAEDLSRNQRLTAIKTIRSNFLTDPDSLIYFKHEYDVMSRLFHPNLARVYDFGQLSDGGYFIAMEYIEGRELNELIKAENKITLSKALPLMAELLRAMEFIHSRNIIYSDIKPQNILITANNQVKLIDFGLSDFSANTSNTVKGTISYLAPEVLKGQTKDHRADIFSLGALFYEMLTGSVFYPEQSIKSILSVLNSKLNYTKLQRTEFEKLPPIVLPVIAKMCSYEAADRYKCCSEVIDALNSVSSQSLPIETNETKEAYVTGVAFTARKHELSYFEKFIAETENKLMLLTGHQGSGKSRLLQEFTKKCSMNDAVVLSGSSVKGESYEPFLSIMSDIIYQYRTYIGNELMAYLCRILPDHQILKMVFPSAMPILDAKILKEILVETISSLIIGFSQFSKRKVILTFSNFGKIDDISMEIIAEILYKINITATNNLKLFAECRSEDQKEVAEFLTMLKNKDRLKVVKLMDFTENEVQAYLNNTFGSHSINHSFKEKASLLYAHCGGNPFFLQELLKSMIADGIITRNNFNWEMTAAVSNAKLTPNIEDVIRNRIRRLKLSDYQHKALMLISFSRQEMLLVNFYSQYVSKIIDLDWQSFFELLVKKEFLQNHVSGYVAQNQLFKEVLHDDLSSTEKIVYHRAWTEILENKSAVCTSISDIENGDLFDLAYHTLRCELLDPLEFERKTATYLFEAAERERSRYANKQSIGFYQKILNGMAKLEFLTTGLQSLQIKIFYNLARIYDLIGKWKEAEEMYRMAVSTADCVNDSEMIAQSKSGLGWLYKNTGRYAEAMLMFDEAGKLADSIGDRKLFALIHGQKGVVYSTRGDFDRALECYQLQERIARETNDFNSLSSAMANIGIVFKNRGDFELALEYYKASSRISQEHGDKHGYSSSLGNIGSIFVMRSDYKQATECFAEKKKICQEIGDKRGFLTAVGNLAAIYGLQGNDELSMQNYEKSRQICLELGDRRGYSIAINNIGLLYLNRNNYQLARQCYDEAIAIGRELQIKYYLCNYLQSKAGLCYILQDYQNSAIYNQEALHMSNEIGRKDVVFSAEILANKLLSSVNPESAVLKLREMLENVHDNNSAAIICYEIYKINRSDEYRNKALKLYRQLHDINPGFEQKKIIDELVGSTIE